MRGAASGGSGGQRRQARLGRAGGVGQTVAQSAVLVLQRRAGLGHHGLRLLQQGPRLWAGLLALQPRVLVVLLLLRSGSTLILTEKEGKRNLGEWFFFSTLSGGTYPKKKKEEKIRWNLRWESLRFHSIHKSFWTLLKERKLCKKRKSAECCWVIKCYTDLHGMSHECCFRRNHKIMAKTTMTMMQIKTINTRNPGRDHYIWDKFPSGWRLMFDDRMCETYRCLLAVREPEETEALPFRSGTGLVFGTLCWKRACNSSPPPRRLCTCNVVEVEQMQWESH